MDIFNKLYIFPTTCFSRLEIHQQGLFKMTFSNLVFLFKIHPHQIKCVRFTNPSYLLYSIKTIMKKVTWFKFKGDKRVQIKQKQSDNHLLNNLCFTLFPDKSMESSLWLLNRGLRWLVVNERHFLLLARSLNLFGAKIPAWLKCFVRTGRIVRPK